MDHLSPSDAEFVEDVVRQHVKFDRILEQQIAIFRNNVSEYEAALVRFQQHPDNLVQPGPGWQPQPGEVESYLNKCESICQMEPLDSRAMTMEERRNFENLPDMLHGERFVLPPNTGESVGFEVIGYRKKRDKSIEYYELLFDDCPDDPIRVEPEEMKNLLQDSHLCTSLSPSLHSTPS